MERLVHFLDFGLHQKFYIKGDLAAAAGDQAQAATDFRNAIAYRVPGNFRLAELELFHHLALDFQSIFAERRQRASRATEFADQHARSNFFQALLMPLEGGEHGRHLVAEGDWHGLLQITAASHRRVAIFLRERCQAIANPVEVLLDNDERLANLHDRGGVSDVLGGGAPVRPFAEPVFAELYKLL